MLLSMNQRLLALTTNGLLWFATVVNPQQLGHTTADHHFRWSERLGHELNYHHTIANAKELAPKERSALLAFVLSRFKHPINGHDTDMFEDISDEQIQNLAANTRIELFDLNGDGKDEIIAQGNGLGPCGGTGNCMVFVLQSTPAGIKTLFDSRAEGFGGFEKIRVLDTATNGFRDIVLASHDSASDRTIEVFRFAGGRYRVSDCYYATTEPAGHPEGLRNPEISRSCPGEK